MKTLVNIQGENINVEDVVFTDAYKYYLSGYKRMLADPQPSDDSIIKMPSQEFVLNEQNFNQ